MDRRTLSEGSSKERKESDGCHDHSCDVLVMKFVKNSIVDNPIIVSVQGSEGLGFGAERERERDRQRDRETETETERNRQCRWSGRIVTIYMHIYIVSQC